MKNLSLFTLSLLVLFSLEVFTSCDKNNPDPDPPINDLDTSTYLPNTFMSNKVGSWWTYGSSGDTTTHNYTRFATGKDSLVNGLIMGYYNREDLVTGFFTADYFGTYENKLATMIDVDGSETSYIPYVFYIRGATLNQEWSNEGEVAYLGITTKVKVNSKLVEENLTLSWGGHTFDSVYHVKSDLLVGLNNINGGVLEVWFNDGLGVIKGVADIDMLNVYSRYYVDSLIDFHIAP